MKVYSAGPCALDGELGDAYFVKCAVTSRIFFLCTLCGVAWERPPQFLVVDTLHRSTKFAPTGISLPTRHDIQASGMESLIANELDLDEYRWRSTFEGWLSAGI